jgi:tetratricopeptide (TPR) repeat protein
MIPQTSISGDPASETALERLPEPDGTHNSRYLNVLLHDKYAEEPRIGQLLRERAGLDGLVDEEDEEDEEDEKASYKDAACNWHIHLTALFPPDRNLMQLANRFLHSRQFIYWAEYSIPDANDFQAIRSTEKILTKWLQSLDDDYRALLYLDDYFEVPYKGNWDDKELYWLARMRLGFYYFDKGRMTDMANTRAEVAKGLSDLLGRSHPLALQASSDATYTLLFNGELREARKIYTEVADDQGKVAVGNDPRPYFTLVYLAQTQYLMVDSLTALGTLKLSVEGFIRTTGSQSNGHLIGQLWTAVAYASLGDVKRAIKILESVRDKRKEQYGPDDSFGIAAQIFAGDLYRKLNVEGKALENIKPALSSRRAFWPLSHFLTLDTALILAITYRDFGYGSEAAQIIAELEQDENVNQEQNFVRSCQVKHMSAWLLFDGGNIDQAIRKLETFLTELDGKRNNRALHWIRLDLAYMLRYRKGEKDAQSARSLFDGIVTDLVDDQAMSADSTHCQAIAERALKLYRFNKVDAAKKLLQEENLRWAQEETLWMWVGVPAADTGWMKLP